MVFWVWKKRPFFVNFYEVWNGPLWSASDHFRNFEFDGDFLLMDFLESSNLEKQKLRNWNFRWEIKKKVDILNAATMKRVSKGKEIFSSRIIESFIFSSRLVLPRHFLSRNNFDLLGNSTHLDQDFENEGIVTTVTT